MSKRNLERRQRTTTGAAALILSLLSVGIPPLSFVAIDSARKALDIDPDNGAARFALVLARIIAVPTAIVTVLAGLLIVISLVTAVFRS